MSGPGRTGLPGVRGEQGGLRCLMLPAGCDKGCRVPRFSGRGGMACVCRSVDSGRISLLVTDFSPEKHPVVAALRRRGVRVLVVPAADGDACDSGR